MPKQVTAKQAMDAVRKYASKTRESNRVAKAHSAAKKSGSANPNLQKQLDKKAKKY